ncbi:MAG: carboxylesterase family protein, partial [Acidobacteriota bacterium]
MVRNTFRMLLVLSLLPLLACGQQAQDPTANAEGVDSQAASGCTTSTIDAAEAGKICGIESSVTTTTEAGEALTIVTNAYLGIPYAQDTSGKKRWTDPQPEPKFTNVHQATAFGPECPQQVGGEVQGEEDCLSLNVWTPANATQSSKLPV